MGKLRGFINAHAKVAERREVAQWIDQVQDIANFEFSKAEIRYLRDYIQGLITKKPHETKEWPQIELLNKLTNLAEKLQETNEETQHDKIFAQRLFCEKRGVLQEAPSNGYCPSCRSDIYYNMTTKQAGSHHVTFCPHCQHSFASTTKKEA